MEQVKGIGAQGPRRELTNVLGIEKIVGSGDLVTRLVEQAIRGGSGWGGGWMHEGQLHNGCARSRQSVKSAVVAPLTK